MFGTLLGLLRDPSLEGVNVDGERRFAVHYRMLARKRMLREVFEEFHHAFRRLDESLLTADGFRIELGAGVAPVRDSYPDVLATDIVPAPHLDRVIDAESMGLPDGSVRAIYCQNSFHHFPDPDRFFTELDRVLAPGGGAILLEPYHGPFATFLFKRLFKTEGFDKTYPSWQTPSAGPMNGANQALSYVVFVRDRGEFERKYPSLKLVHQEVCKNHFKYLLSGGLNFRQLLPNLMSPATDLLQRITSPLNHWISLHHMVVIRKDPTGSAATDFQLELQPHQIIQKVLPTGRLVESQAVHLAQRCEGIFGIPLEIGEAIVSPLLLIGKEHHLYVSLTTTEQKGSGGSILLEYAEIHRDWAVLAEVRVGGCDATADPCIELSLANLAGRTCRFRVARSDNSESPCTLILFRVCSYHRVGRVNALSNYEFRMQNEAVSFSAKAYQHPIYGLSAPAGGNLGNIDAATVEAQDRDSELREAQTARARERLTRLEPVPGEIAFTYAIRALHSLLPIKAPNFYWRAKCLSDAKPLRILSICSGAARIEEQILSHCAGPVELILLDASLDLVKRAADRLTNANSERRIECLIGDVNAGLPGSGLFDVIVCASALHHVADLETVLGQINQRLTADGEFWSIGEQIGRNGNRLWPEAYDAANRAFARLPSYLRLNAYTKKIDAFLTDRDFSAVCFEGVRSEELEHLLEAYFVPDHVYKRNAFLWRLVDATYSDNFVLTRAEDLEQLRELVCAEAVHWANGGRATELHGIYRKKDLR